MHADWARIVPIKLQMRHTQGSRQDAPVHYLAKSDKPLFRTLVKAVILLFIITGTSICFAINPDTKGTVSIFIGASLGLLAGHPISAILAERLGLNGRSTLDQQRRIIHAVYEEHRDRNISLISPLAAKIALFNESNFVLFISGSLEKDTSAENKGVRFLQLREMFADVSPSGWATPESLDRQRPTPGRKELQSLMERQRIGAIVAVPRGSPTPTLFLVLGTRIDEWPYTYPEIERLLNLAELVDNLLTRAQLAEQEAMRAKMEYLAVMSRGLAHDLRNLITPISSFLVYTEDRLQTGSAEGEVHAAARHSVDTMNAYVRDALFFAQRLEPNLARTDPRLLLDQVIEASAPRAAQRNIRLVRACQAAEGITADTVLLQRLLANLVANAIDASPDGETVQITCLSDRAGWVCFEVEDHGPGISPENLRQVFDPYFTTKQFGNEIRGFGLGLTICQKIAQLHQGVVSFASDRARGALARFEMPVVPGATSTPRLYPVAA